MIDLKPGMDEDQVWKLCFPNIYRKCRYEGVYVIKSEEELALAAKEHSASRTDVDRCLSRLDAAITYLWPAVSDLFAVDFFPHRLAAATDLLRAVDFGEEQSPRVQLLAKELSDAVTALEKTLKAAAPNVHLVADTPEQPEE